MFCKYIIFSCIYVFTRMEIVKCREIWFLNTLLSVSARYHKWNYKKKILFCYYSVLDILRGNERDTEKWSQMRKQGGQTQNSGNIIDVDVDVYMYSKNTSKRILWLTQLPSLTSQNSHSLHLCKKKSMH